MKDYKFENNTYKREVKRDPKDRIGVEIGDSKQPDFKPQAKIMRWDNEVNFSIRVKDNDPDTPNIVDENGMIKYKKEKWEAHFYDLAPEDRFEDGGFELEVLLNERPKGNKVEFSIETKGLDFFYQPELSKEEVAEGIYRSEEAECSYAVYHSDKFWNSSYGKRYGTGKAFHIFRPKITDANGVKIWGELTIDVKRGVLTVTIPQKFLVQASYPMIVDPTFGYTGTGVTISGHYNHISGSTFTCPVNCEIESMTYRSYSSNFSDEVQMAIYLASNSSFVGRTIPGGTPGGPAQANTQDIYGVVQLDGGEDYTLCEWGSDSFSGIAFDYSAVNSLDRTITYDSTNWPDPSGLSATYGRQYSIYATYTEISSSPTMSGIQSIQGISSIAFS